MPYHHPFPSLRTDQRGAVAITAVIGMTLITLTMGLALADIALREDAKSRNNYETEQAFASASGCTEYALQMLKGNENFNSPYDAFGSGLVTGDTECYTEITPAVPPINGRLIGQGKRGNKVRKIVTDYLEAGPAPATRLPLDVVLALDRSNSMSDDSITAMRTAAHAFVNLLNFTASTADSDRVAVVTFTIEAGDPQLITDPTLLNRAYLNQYMTRFDSNVHTAITNITKRGQTNIEGALLIANDEMNNGNHSRLNNATDHNVVVLMSDGMANYRNSGASYFGCETCPDYLDGQTCSPAAITAAGAIRTAYPNNVEIYSVSYNFGTLECPSGETPTSWASASELHNAEDTLQKIANSPVYYLVADESNIIETFQTIANEVTKHRLRLSSWREE